MIISAMCLQDLGADIETQPGSINCRRVFVSDATEPLEQEGQLIRSQANAMVGHTEASLPTIRGRSQPDRDLTTMWRIFHRIGQ